MGKLTVLQCYILRIVIYELLLIGSQDNHSISRAVVLGFANTVDNLFFDTEISFRLRNVSTQ